MTTDFERELDEIFADLDPRLEAEAHLALDIASQFTALRKRRGMSQRELAERLGRTQQTVSKIENPPHEGHNLARLKEAVAAMGAFLDVTIVPVEDAAAYRARHRPKPALGTVAGPRSDAGTSDQAIGPPEDGRQTKRVAVVTEAAPVDTSPDIEAPGSRR